MARGTNSRVGTFSGERPFTKAERVAALKAMYNFDGDAKTKAVAERIATEKKPKDIKAFVSFISTIKAYQGDQHFRQKGYLERRDAIVKAYEKLPEYIKSEVRAPASVLGSLVRGATTAASAGPAGKINASFESKITSVGVWGNAEGKRKDYTSKDIASHGDIINFHRAWEIANAVNERGVVRGSTLELGSDSEQNEFLVTDIKWKDGVV